MLSGMDVSCIADSRVEGITELSAMAAMCVIGVVVTLISPAQLKSCWSNNNGAYHFHLHSYLHSSITL